MEIFLRYLRIFSSKINSIVNKSTPCKLLHRDCLISLWAGSRLTLCLNLITSTLHHLKSIPALLPLLANPTLAATSRNLNTRLLYMCNSPELLIDIWLGNCHRLGGYFLFVTFLLRCIQRLVFCKGNIYCWVKTLVEYHRVYSNWRIC